MATCKDCIHERICKYANENLTIETKVKDIIHSCLDYQPTADVVEVVRCKDCKYCKLTYPEKELNKEPTPVYCCEVYRWCKQPTDFCSYGEKRG